MRCVTTIVVALVTASIASQTRLPRVLLLGDSIYNEPSRRAREMLKGRVELVTPKTRLGNTTQALARLDGVLGTGKWDLIHFNFGLADLHYRDPKSLSIRALSKHAGGVRVTSPEQYEDNVGKIVKRLRKTGAKLLWATTTPIGKSKYDSIFDPGSELEYNRLAARVMAKNGVAINDMHSYVRVTVKKHRDPFWFDREPLHPPIVRRILEELDLVRPVHGPVQVFVMVGGWSHIGGGIVLGRDKPRKGPRGSLDHLVLSAETAGSYRHLLERDGRWATRPDVWVQFDRRGTKSGTLGIGFGGDRKRGIGSELALGHVLGDHFAEQVYILKTALGTPSLAKELCPPSSGKPGRAYTRLARQLRDSLARLSDRFPDYTSESRYEIAGLILNLGEQDSDARLYAERLPMLIDDLRKELGKPRLPTVIVGTGKGGRAKPSHQKILAAQQAVAAIPRFAGSVRYVETRDFWPAENARNAFRYPSADRWFDNAESFYEMGKAAGAAMLGLLRSR